DRDVVLQQQLQRLRGVACGQQSLADVTEDCLVGQKLRRLIVDEQNVDLVFQHDVFGLSDATSYGERTIVVRCSPASPGSPRRRHPGTVRGRLSSLLR